MRCERAQPLLSARIDGEHISRAAAPAVDAHAATCPSCAAFLERSARVRAAVRIRPAEPVPDLIDPIMAAVAAEVDRTPGRRLEPERRATRRRDPRPRTRPRDLIGTHRRTVAAAVVGVIVGSLAMGGPWRSPDEQPIALAAVVANVRAAAGSLDAYSATYEITERGLSDEVPERRLEVDVAFLAPQRFRMDVRDLTVYPSAAWTPTDLTYVEDAPASFRSGPYPCPPALEACPTWRDGFARTSEFSAAAPLPVDLIVPIATFGSTDGIRVSGPEEVGGHDSIHVVTTFDRASPLFPFLRLGGTWRPFFGGDRVDLWLDTTSWVPLRYTVTPSQAEARRAWEMRFGRPVERPDAPILEVRAIVVRAEPPDPSRFAIPGLDDPDRRFASLEARIGYTPITPAGTGGLELVSASTPGDRDDAAPRSLLVYARGLDYLRIAEHPSWAGPGPFGAVALDAELIDLGGGVARFEPAADGFGNRIAIHADETDLYLESNLPREDLLTIARSLPVHGVLVGGDGT
jgi:hypothetical protein